MAPVVFLELALLFQIGRIREPPEAIVRSLTAAVGLEVARTPFYDACRLAADCTWTRDPFDRLIVASAALAKARLLTADDTILENFGGAAWR